VVVGVGQVERHQVILALVAVVAVAHLELRCYLALEAGVVGRMAHPYVEWSASMVKPLHHDPWLVIFYHPRRIRGEEVPWCRIKWMQGALRRSACLPLRHLWNPLSNRRPTTHLLQVAHVMGEFL
jgi:hypothetical protein